PMHVVRTEHRDVSRLLVGDQVHRLQDGVSTAGVPPRPEALLRRDWRDVVTEQSRHPPGLSDVLVQRVRLVLREYADPQETCVDHVRQHKVDQSIAAPERDGRFGTVSCQGPEALSFATCKDYAEYADTSSHNLTIVLETRL